MKLSRSIGYALAAAGYIAENGIDRPVLAKRIAEYHKIPLEYLLKILQQLVHAKVVRSIRGPQGGFLLADDPHKISLLQVIEAVEAPFDGASVSFSADYFQAAAATFRQAAQQASQMLAETSLADVLGAGGEKGAQGNG